MAVRKTSGSYNPKNFHSRVQLPAALLLPYGDRLCIRFQTAEAMTLLKTPKVGFIQPEREPCADEGDNVNGPRFRRHASMMASRTASMPT